MYVIRYYSFLSLLFMATSLYADDHTSPLDALRAESISEKLRPNSPIPGLVSVIQFIPKMEFRKTEFGSITELKYSPDGKKIIVGTYRPSQIRVLDAATFEDLVPPTFSARSDFAQPSPDGQHILADTLLRYKDNKLQDTKWFPEKSWPQTVKAWSPDGKRVATSGSSKSLNLWDMSRELPLILADCKVDSRISSITYCPDGKWLASGHTNGSIRLWDVTVQPPHEVFKTPGHPDSIREMQFSHDGRYLYSIGSQGNKAQRWSHTSGKLIRVDTTPDSALGNARRIALSPDDTKLAVARNDGAVEIYQISTEEIMFRAKLDRVHRGSVDTIAFSPDGKTLLSGGYDHCLVSWNIGGWLPSVNRQIAGRECLFLPYGFANDGSVLMVRDYSYVYPIIFGDVQPKLLRMGISMGMDATASDHSRLLAFAYLNYAEYNSASGKSNIGNEHPKEKNLHVYDFTDKRLKKLFELGGPSVASSLFSPDGTYLIEFTGEWDKNRVWNINGKEPLAIDFQPEQQKASHFPVHSLRGSFSKSGKLLATLDVTTLNSGVQKTKQCHVSLWDASDWKRQRYWQVPDDTINLSLSPDGSLLACLIRNGSIQIWLTATGQLRRTFPKETNVTSFAWSADGSYLTTLDHTGWVQRWNVDSGHRQYEWRLPKYPLRNDTLGPPARGVSLQSVPLGPFQLAPDGRHIAVSNTDGTIYIFRTPEIK